MPRMLPDGRRLGAHLPLGHGMVKAVDRAHEIGADAPSRSSPTTRPPGDAGQRRRRSSRAFRERLAELDIAPGRDPCRRTSSTSPVPRRTSSSGPSSPGQRPADGARVRGRVRERPHRARIAAPASRPGSSGWPTGSRSGPGRGRSDAPTAPVDRARELGGGRVRPRHRPRRAGGDRRGARRARHRRRSARVLPRHGACLGRRDRPVASPSRVDAFLADFDARIGLDRLVMVHLNDSKSELGSRIDRHEHLGAGRIGDARPGSPPPPPGAGPRRLLPRDAGDGRGLRRGQRRARLRHRRRAAPRRPAARGDGAPRAAGRRSGPPAEPEPTGAR